MDDSDLESSSDENEEDARTDADFRSEVGSDEENEEEDDFDLDIPSSSEDEASKKDEESDYEDDDVFGSRSASARKRKAGTKGSPSKRAKAGGSSRRRSRYDNDVGNDVVVLRPSAATLKKNAALAERRQQRLAERQARRLQPRLPLVQQRNLGLDNVESNMSPFEKARTVLHVGCTPDYLPCRDEEYAEVEAYLEDAIDEGVGSCICELTLVSVYLPCSRLLLQISLVCREQERLQQCGVSFRHYSNAQMTKRSSLSAFWRSTA